MRTRCPSCGATLSLDALIAHDAAREALAAAFKLSGQLKPLALAGGFGRWFFRRERCQPLTASA